jgi:hypothetical protein
MVSLPTEELQPLLALLTSFWHEMKEWEAYCCGLEKLELAGEISTEQLKDLILPRAAEIFERHCDLNKKEPDRIKGGRFNFGSPPQYDPDLDTLVTVKKTKAGYSVQVRNGGRSSHLFTYTVVNINGILKLKDHRIFEAQGRRIASGL